MGRPFSHKTNLRISRENERESRLWKNNVNFSIQNLPHSSSMTLISFAFPFLPNRTAFESVRSRLKPWLPHTYRRIHRRLHQPMAPWITITLERREEIIPVMLKTAWQTMYILLLDLRHPILLHPLHQRTRQCHPRPLLPRKCMTFTTNTLSTIINIILTSHTNRFFHLLPSLMPTTTVSNLIKELGLVENISFVSYWICTLFLIPCLSSPSEQMPSRNEFFNINDLEERRQSDNRTEDFLIDCFIL